MPAAEDGLPVAFATRFPAAIIIDAHTRQAFVVCESAFENCYKQILHDLSQSIPGDLYQQEYDIGDIQEDVESEYLRQLDRLHQYIVDGDVFQVNLSRRWRTRLSRPVSHASLYYQLTNSNPGPFNAA